MIHGSYQPDDLYPYFIPCWFGYTSVCVWITASSDVCPLCLGNPGCNHRWIGEDSGIWPGQVFELKRAGPGIDWAVSLVHSIASLFWYKVNWFDYFVRDVLSTRKFHENVDFLHHSLALFYWFNTTVALIWTFPNIRFLTRLVSWISAHPRLHLACNLCKLARIRWSLHSVGFAWTKNGKSAHIGRSLLAYVTLVELLSRPNAVLEGHQEAIVCYCTPSHRHTCVDRVQFINDLFQRSFILHHGNTIITVSTLVIQNLL